MKINDGKITSGFTILGKITIRLKAEHVILGKSSTGLNKDENKRVEKKQTPNPIKWKDMIQEVQLIEKVTHKCGELWEIITV